MSQRFVNHRIDSVEQLTRVQVGRFLNLRQVSIAAETA
jgi:hypothetical protein